MPTPATPIRTALEQTYDFVVIGSGFGGSVSAMRLTEKGYRVLVLERGKRFRDQDFPKSNWVLSRYLWMPAVRFFGFMQMSLLKGVFVMHGSGVGGGSLVYAGVLMEPPHAFFDSPAWSHLGDWKAELRPHYATARRMLGVTTNPQLWEADLALQSLARSGGQPDGFRNTEVGIFFGEPGVEVADPYFDGRGPVRSGCTHCGGCMVGCRFNAKNTLTKNYLYFAEQGGAEIRPDSQVEAIRPLAPVQADGARYVISWRTATGWVRGSAGQVRARNVVLSAGVLGTLPLLLRCRDELGTLPGISHRLGSLVRTNSESFVGAWSKAKQVDHSKGVAITSIMQADATTQVEVVRFPDGSSFMYWLLGTPFVRAAQGFMGRLFNLIRGVLAHPLVFLRSKLGRGISLHTVALMIMQTEENSMSLHLRKRRPLGLGPALYAQHDRVQRIPINTTLGHDLAHGFANRLEGIPYVSITESLLGIPMTAHILGGCPFGRDASEGVIGLDCQVHGYPGLYVIDGSIVSANPGVNPSLTITALAEYAMSRVPEKGLDGVRSGFGEDQ